MYALKITLCKGYPAGAPESAWGPVRDRPRPSAPRSLVLRWPEGQRSSGGGDSEDPSRDAQAPVPGHKKPSLPREAVQRAEPSEHSQVQRHLTREERLPRPPSFPVVACYRSHAGVFGCGPKSRTWGSCRRVKERVGAKRKRRQRSGPSRASAASRVPAAPVPVLVSPSWVMLTRGGAGRGLGVH